MKASAAQNDSSAKWLDPAAAAAYCSLSIETIRRAARAGRLQVVYAGRAIRTTRAWLDTWMEGGARPSESDAQNGISGEHVMPRRVTAAH